MEVSMKLNYTEEMFVAEYLRNGQNGTRAYLSIRPRVTERSAAVSANRLLKSPAVIEAIKGAVAERFDESIASREHLIKEANEIGKEARGKGVYGAALNAVELKAKLNKLFDRDEPEMDRYYQVIQALTINPSSEHVETVDVTPKAVNVEKNST
jgi:hypothetical protein